MAGMNCGSPGLPSPGPESTALSLGPCHHARVSACQSVSAGRRPAPGDREAGAALREGQRNQTLLGVTGSGKTFTMANVIARSAGRPW